MERFVYVTVFKQYLNMFRVSWLLKKKKFICYYSWWSLFTLFGKYIALHSTGH